MKFSRSEILRILPIAKRRAGAKLASWVERLFSGEKLLKDVFGTRRSKRVLICYLPEAFLHKKLPKYHSNFTECYTAAKCFDRLGYSVDCASRNKSDIDYSGYEIVYGINCKSFWASFSADSSVQPLRIFYSVGAHTFYNFEETARRNIEFFDEHGLWLLSSSHYIPGNGMNYYAARFSDAVICLGDSFVTRKFIADDSCANKYYTLPAFYFPVTTPDEKKNFDRIRNNILWFGSSGMLHKGLDIAIDFAVRHPKYTLHICGGSRHESDFWNCYKRKISDSKNIIVHGFVNIESTEFSQLLEECAILLNPSLSESGAVSVLNVLGNGALLPLLSKGTGLDLPSSCIEVDNVNYSAFEQALLGVEQMSAEEIALRAWEVYRFVKSKYTLMQYEERLYKYLNKIIDNRNR